MRSKLAHMSAPVVEDHEFQRQVALRLLRQMGTGHPLEAADGHSAPAVLAEQRQPQVAIGSGFAALGMRQRGDIAPNRNEACICGTSCREPDNGAFIPRLAHGPSGRLQAGADAPHSR